jgi:hypothetical protein
MLIKAKIQSTSVKSTVKFGNYEQDNNTSNGKEEIEWIVLAKEDGKALLISKDCLDFRPFHNQNSSVTWESCTLRTWLNNTFYSTAFGTKYNKLILSSTISNVGCGNTVDKVFLLSQSEVLTYFSSNGARQAKATKYAQALGAEVSQYTYSSQWMLRTPGYIDSVPMFVRLPGDLSSHNDHYSYEKQEYTSVRPAIWVDISEIE